jgi:hypothetical protein
MNKHSLFQNSYSKIADYLPGMFIRICDRELVTAFPKMLSSSLTVTDNRKNYTQLQNWSSFRRSKTFGLSFHFWTTYSAPTLSSGADD